MYEVQNILGFMWHDSQKFFKIHWVGYPQEEATWEPENNLVNYHRECDIFYRQWLKQNYDITSSESSNDQIGEDNKQTENQKKLKSKKLKILIKRKQKSKNKTKNKTKCKKSKQPRLNVVPQQMNIIEQQKEQSQAIFQEQEIQLAKESVKDKQCHKILQETKQGLQNLSLDEKFEIIRIITNIMNQIKQINFLVRCGSKSDKKFKFNKILTKQQILNNAPDLLLEYYQSEATWGY